MYASAAATQQHLAAATDAEATIKSILGAITMYWVECPECYAVTLADEGAPQLPTEQVSFIPCREWSPAMRRSAVLPSVLDA